MSHSTHVGFSAPPTSAFSGFVLRSICEGAPLFFASCAVGVGHIATAVCRLIPVPLRVIFAKSGPAADAFGVGQSFATIPRSLFRPRSHSLAAPSSVRDPFVPSVARGVGNEPDSFSFVGSTGMDSSQHSVSSHVAHRGQLGSDSDTSAKSESWGVFHEDVARSNLANDPPHFPPQSASLAFEPRAFARDADVLAWEASRYHVNKSSPWRAVEGAYIIPDREGVQASIVLTGDQHVPCIGVVLDGAHGSESAEESAEYAASSACE